MVFNKNSTSPIDYQLLLRPNPTVTTITPNTPLPLIKPWLLRPIRPLRLNLLPPLHPRPKRNIHPRRRTKPKRLGHLHQIQLINIKYTPQSMACICLKITLIAVLSGLIQKVIGTNKFFELRLDVDNFLGGKVELDDRDAGLL